MTWGNVGELWVKQVIAQDSTNTPVILMVLQIDGYTYFKSTGSGGGKC